MKNLTRVAILAIVVAIMAGAAYWYYQGHAKTTSAATGSQTYTQVVPVKQGSVSSTISVVGQMEAVQDADLAFEHMSGVGTLQSLAVKAGSVVTTGQVLATINATPYQAALDQAKSALAAAEKTLANLTTPATALKLAQADVAVAKAELAIQQAENALDDLVNPDMASLESAVANAESALAKAQADVLSKQQDQSYKDQLAKLVNAEATPTTTYSRLAAESTPAGDASYQDRLLLAYNKMADAQAARASYELAAQISASQAQTSVRKADVALADAQEALATAQAGGDKLAIAKARVTLQDAQVALQAAQAAKADLVAGADTTTIATAQADVDKKKLAVADAQAALDGAKLTAPFDGTILKVNVAAGNQVGANTTILSIADLKSVQVVASIDETTIRKVSAGQDATITFDAYAGQTFKGKVQSVPLQGALQGGVMVYSVPISLTGADKLSLLVGMTANVKIQAGTAANALLVPTLALQKSNGQYQVLVPNTTDPNGSPEAVPVEVGLSDGTYTQITKGLNAGDQIITQVKSTSSSSQQQMGGPGMDMGGAPLAPPSR